MTGLETPDWMLFRHAIFMFACASGLHYNITNILAGIFAAENKLHAFAVMVPFIQSLAALVVLFWSPSFHAYPALFLGGVGIFLTYVTGWLNICCTAQIPFPTFYVEPYIFAILFGLEFTQQLPRDQTYLFYSVLGLTILVKYLRFMTYVVSTLCEKLNIRLLTVKPESEKTTKGEEKTKGDWVQLINFD